MITRRDFIVTTAATASSRGTACLFTSEGFAEGSDLIREANR